MSDVMQTNQDMSGTSIVSVLESMSSAHAAVMVLGPSTALIPQPCSQRIREGEMLQLLLYQDRGLRRAILACIEIHTSHAIR